MRTISILILLIIAEIIILLSFYLSAYNNLTGALQLSFTVIGGLSSLITLIIAVLLFQRFGIDSMFMTKRTEAVLQLVDQLKEINIRATANGGTLFVKFRKENILQNKRQHEFYKDIYKRSITFKVKDYEKFYKQLYESYSSYWLPEDLREKMFFLISFKAYKSSVNFAEKIKTANFIFLEEKPGDWLVGLPEQSVEGFQKNINLLVGSIEKWLSKHSNIKLNIRMDEPLRF